MGEQETDPLVVAMVVDVDADHLRWLLRRAENGVWQFIATEPLDGEPYHEALRRELAWQLNLDRSADFVISSMAQLNVECQDADGSVRQVAFYPVHIYRRSTMQTLHSDDGLRWFRAPEICDGKAADGGLIDPTQVSWIRRWEIVQHWQ